MMTHRLRAFFLIAASLIGAAPVLADSQREALGYLDLIQRLGGDAPDGTDIIFGQTEARSAGNYLPDFNHARFAGKTFIIESGNSGVSGHATVVGRHGYGNGWSIAPGVTLIHCYEANGWLGGDFLRTASGLPPLVAPVDLFNASWIGTAGGFDNEILRRVDFVIENQDALMIVGLNNGNAPLNVNDRLLSHNFNGLTVGTSDGDHHHGNTLFGLDGPGRMKPEIVAPDRTTSWTTGLISGVVATLLETARTTQGLGNNPNADRSLVIKGILLAGATRRAGWSNNPIENGNGRGRTSAPLDPVFGADQANINTSHMIFTGLEQDGSTTVPLNGSKALAGWDLTPIDANDNRFYRFELREAKPFASMLITWNRRPNQTFTSFTMPNLNLELFAVDDQGMLISLRGDNGINVFETGSNIASTSTVDNIELVHVRNLQAGNYVLRVRRMNDSLGEWEAAVAWFIPPAVSETADLVDLTLLDGTIISGGLPEMESSDDTFLITEARVTGEVHQPHLLRMQVGAVTAVQNPDTIDLTLESRITDIEATVWLFLRDWNTGDMVQVDQFMIGMQEEVHQVTVPDAGRFVRTSDGRIELEIKKIVFFPFTLSGFNSLIDHVRVGVR